LYLVPKHREDGSRNGISMRRLKPKLGTKSVPTGEVEFHDALGYALRAAPGGNGGGSSDAGGLGRMMEMVNGSRFGVAMMGLGIARRSFLEGAIWAHHRRAKGRLLVDLPLIREQLVDQLTELEAAFALGFECAAAARSQDGDRLRRVLVPAAKVRLCRFGVEAASQAVELHGGNGYCEDWPLTRQLRDAQCHPIWEGTEQICELDVLRAIRRDAAHEAALARIDRALGTAGSGPDYLDEVVTAVTAARNELERRVNELPSIDADLAEASAARITALLTHAVAAALLVEQSYEPHKALVSLRYTRRNLSPSVAWADRIAAVAGRELLAFDDLDHATAEKAAA
jgi:acyl-CoA dehydrogenase